MTTHNMLAKSSVDQCEASRMANQQTRDHITQNSTLL